MQTPSSSSEPRWSEAFGHVSTQKLWEVKQLLAGKNKTAPSGAFKRKRTRFFNLALLASGRSGCHARQVRMRRSSFYTALLGPMLAYICKQCPWYKDAFQKRAGNVLSLVLYSDEASGGTC